MTALRNQATPDIACVPPIPPCCAPSIRQLRAEKKGTMNRATKMLPIGPPPANFGKVSITMPIPPRCLSPNASHSRNYFAKSTARREQRETAATYAGAQFRGPGPKWPRFRVVIRWFAADRGKIPDLDNGVACCKGIIDGMVDAGVMLNDKGWEGVDWWPVTDKANPRVEIEVQKVIEPKH